MWNKLDEMGIDNTTIELIKACYRTIYVRK